MVNETNAAGIAERLFHYYENRYLWDGQVLLEAEQVGQIYGIANDAGRQLSGMIEELDIDLLGGFLTAVQLRGKIKE